MHIACYSPYIPPSWGSQQPSNVLPPPPLAAFRETIWSSDWAPSVPSNPKPASKANQGSALAVQFSPAWLLVCFRWNSNLVNILLRQLVDLPLQGWSIAVLNRLAPAIETERQWPDTIPQNALFVLQPPLPVTQQPSVAVQFPRTVLQAPGTSPLAQSGFSMHSQSSCLSFERQGSDYL